MVNAVKQLLTDMLGTIQSTHLVIFILGILIFMLSFLPAIKQVTTKQQEHIRHKAIVTIRTILIVAALFVLGWEGMQTYNIILSLRG
jgi:heme/copper-type cytochrome/quinol oxidase subunit 2